MTAPSGNISSRKHRESRETKQIFLLYVVIERIIFVTLIYIYANRFACSSPQFSIVQLSLFLIYFSHRFSYILFTVFLI